MKAIVMEAEIWNNRGTDADIGKMMLWLLCSNW